MISVLARRTTRSVGSSISASLVAGHHCLISSLSIPTNIGSTSTRYDTLNKDKVFAVLLNIQPNQVFDCTQSIVYYSMLPRFAFLQLVSHYSEIKLMCLTGCNIIACARELHL